MAGGRVPRRLTTKQGGGGRQSVRLRHCDKMNNAAVSWTTLLLPFWCERRELQRTGARAACSR